MDKQTKKRLTENRAKFIREGSEANWLSLAKVMGKKNNRPGGLYLGPVWPGHASV